MPSENTRMNCGDPIHEQELFCSRECAVWYGGGSI